MGTQWHKFVYWWCWENSNYVQDVLLMTWCSTHLMYKLSCSVMGTNKKKAISTSHLLQLLNICMSKELMSMSENICKSQVQVWLPLQKWPFLYWPIFSFTGENLDGYSRTWDNVHYLDGTPIQTSNRESYEKKMLSLCWNCRHRPHRIFSFWHIQAKQCSTNSFMCASNPFHIFKSSYVWTRTWWSKLYFLFESNQTWISWM